MQSWESVMGPRAELVSWVNNFWAEKVHLQKIHAVLYEILNGVIVPRGVHFQGRLTVKSYKGGRTKSQRHQLFQ